MSLPERERTTPLGLWRYAKEFAESGHAAHRLEPTRMYVPAYYLMGHSIELSLKAFLLGRGETLVRLKSRAFGHDLDALLKESRHRQIGREVTFSKFDGPVIHLLNIEYKDKRFEYIRTGMMHVPDWHLVASVTDKLVADLREFCKRHG